MSGALMVMPMLIINMGAEMLYVLDQRLKAQQIPREKACKVLEDIVKTMHNDKFMTELFKPHRMYSNVATRQIFDRLAHSSIMRLNTNSMDKLYDLMRMGFKYQVLSCASADQLVHVTMNHLEHTKMLIDADDVKKLVDETILLTSQSFGMMTPAELYMLKQYLCRFFQNTRVKVSLFLQNGIQSMDGTLTIRYDGVTASGGKVPGTIRYYEDDKAQEEVRFTIASAEHAVEAPDVPVLERKHQDTQLGRNMYDANSKSTAKSSADMSADAKRTGPRLMIPSKQKSFKATASDGLNLLADLVGSCMKDTEDKSFKINLFPDDAARGSADDDADDNGKEVPTIWIDAATERKDTASDLLEGFEASHKHEGKDDDDDLLKLMDSAT